MKTRIKKLTIDRARWGVGRFGGKLLQPGNGKMCCLGFAMIALGFTKSRIRGISMPSTVARGLRKPLKYMSQFVEPSGFNNDTCSTLANANDSRTMTDRNREAAVKRGFKRLGITVRFVGKYSGEHIINGA